MTRSAKQQTFRELEFDTLARNLRAAADAALANSSVKEFIAEGTYWTAASVRSDPPAWLVFEQGEICGNVGELRAVARYGIEQRKLGRPVRIRTLRPDDEIFEVFWTVEFSPTHPRRRRLEQRLKLKQQLGRHKPLVSKAMRLTQSRFVEEVRGERGLSTRIKERTGLTIKQLWRKARFGPSGRATK